MIWPLLIMAGMSMLSQGQQANAQAKASKAANKAAMEANTENMLRVGFKVGLLNVQKAQQTRQNAQLMADNGVGALAAVSNVNNTAAASGTIGASVDAVANDVQMQYDNQKAQIQQKQELEQLNYTSSLADLIAQGQDSLSGGNGYRAPSQIGMVAQAGISAVSKYYGDKMDLGLGTQGQSSGGTFGNLFTRG